MYDVERAVEQWRDGESRVDTLDDRRRQQRVYDLVGVVVGHLRQRLGGPFTVAELAEVYREGTDWIIAIATEHAPEDPALWDPRLVADAAFARYVRNARDFAGGRWMV